MPRICVFDVNETLLDLAVLDAPFESAFGRPGVRREWFSQLLQSAFLATVTDAYVDFGTIGRAALEMVAERRGVRLSSPDREAILGTMLTLPPRHARASLSVRPIRRSPARSMRQRYRR